MTWHFGRRSRRLIGLLLVIWGSGVDAVAADRSAVSIVEGHVIEVGQRIGEGDLELVTARLGGIEVPGGEVELLLAPREVLEEIGFDVAAGDRLKARVFDLEEGVARVHKVRNLTSSSMVRLRTLRQIPLWDGNAVWQGSSGRSGAPRGRGPSGRTGVPPSPRGGAGPG